MGFLYPYAAIQRGEIPEEDSFLRARDEMMAKFREAKARGFISFAGVYGSVIPGRGDHNRRSDIDVFVIYPAMHRRKSPRKAKRARQVLRDVREIGRRHHVVVNARCVPAYSAAKGEHPFGPSFKGMWKELAAQGMLVGDPAALEKALYVPKGRTVRDEMFARVSRYLHRARRHLRDYEGQDKSHHGDPDPACESALRRCVRPLHLFLNLARKLLWWENGELPDHRKKPVLAAFAATDAFAPMHPHFRALRKIDTEYEALLRRALAGEVGKDEYREQLHSIMTRTLQENVKLLETAVAYMETTRSRRRYQPSRRDFPASKPPLVSSHARGQKRERAKAASA